MAVGRPAIITTEYVSTCFVLPDELLALSDEELEEVRDVAGLLIRSWSMLLCCAMTDRSLLILLAKITKTTADMFEEEMKEIQAADAA